MKKFVSFVIAASMAAALAGCQPAATPTPAPPPAETAAAATSTPSPTPSPVPTEAPATEAPQAAVEKTVITVTRWGDAGQQNDPEKIMIDKFNQENDLNIELVYDLIPGDGYGDRLTTSFSSGEGYDIFASGEGDFYKWVKAGLTRPLNDLIATDTTWNNQMAKALYDMGNIEGNQYYLIRDFNTIAMFYAKDVFDKHNVPYPTRDWTWEDLYRAAVQLTAKNDDGSFASFGFNAQSWGYAVLSFLISNGVDIMDENGTTIEGYMNSPEVAALLDMYVFASEGENRMSPTAADASSFGSPAAMMAEGKLAMTMNGGWMRGQLDENKVNYGTVIAPGTHKTYLCAAAFAMSSRVKNPEAAWEAMKLLTGEEISQLKVANSAVFPTIDRELQKLIDNADDTTVGLLEQIAYAVQPVGVRSALGEPASRAFGEALERIIFRDGDTQSILNDAVKDALEYAK